MNTYSISTNGRDSLTDITLQVQQAVTESGLSEGVCLISCPHTTAGITINENADPDVPRDILHVLDQVIPWRGDYRHGEGNTAAHVKSSLVGCSAQVIISEGRLVLGTWQSVFFCEFDGSRSRRFLVQVVPA